MELQTLKQYLEIIAPIVVIVGGLGYGISAFLKGGLRGKTDTLESENALTTYLKNQIETYKGIVDEFNKKLTDMGKEMSAMKAVIDEKDKTIQKYLDILQNRNPELDKFIAEMSGTMKDIKNFMVKVNDHMEQDLQITGTLTTSK